MSDQKQYSVQGSWLGNYYYDGGAQLPCSFEAVFVESGGRVDGSILDDGRLGEAQVSGSFSYPSLTFTKSYYNSTLTPVRYDGVMSEEGKKLSGRWHISGDCHGTWHAWRSDCEEEESETLETVEKVEVPLTATSPQRG